MVSIFDFTDFREYLRSYFEDKKRSNSRFSYQSLAQKAGFNNRGFVYNIIKGKKKLSKTHCYQLSKALGLNEKETLYFEHLVAYAQVEQADPRNHYREKIEQYRNEETLAGFVSENDKQEYVSKWYHGAIRGLIDLIPVKNNYEVISKKLVPQITIAQAKNSLELLERLGLIRKDENGFYRNTEKNVDQYEKNIESAVDYFQIECLELAKQKILRHDKKWDFTYLITMSLSKNATEQITEETRAFIRKIMKIAKNDNNAQRIYHYLLTMFPLSSGTRIEHE